MLSESLREMLVSHTSTLEKSPCSSPEKSNLNIRIDLDTDVDVDGKNEGDEEIPENGEDFVLV